MRIPISRSSLIKIIVLVLFLSCLAFVYSQFQESTAMVKIEMKDTIVPHSFSLDATGFLSDVEEEVKKGQYKLNKYDIGNALFPSFQCESVKLQPDYLLEIGNMKMPLSAYDPESKIGFILLDYHVLGPGLSKKSSQHKSQHETQQSVLSQVEDGVELFLDDEEKFIKEMFGEDPNKIEEEADTEFQFNTQGDVIFTFDPGVSAEERARIISESSKASNREFMQRRRIHWNSHFTPTRRAWSYFAEGYDHEELMYRFGQEIKEGIAQFQTFQEKQEYLEEMFLGFKKKIYLDQLNEKNNKTYLEDWIFSAAEQISDPLRFFGIAERIKYLGYPGSNNTAYSVINNEVLKISLYDDSREWWKHSEALIALLQANETPVTNSKKEYYDVIAEIITKYPYKKWPNHYDKINELGNEYTISLEELKALLSISKTHGICIAPISVKDERIIYDMKEEEYQNELAQLRKEIRQSKDKKVRKTLQEKLLELSHNRSKNYRDIRDEAKMKSANVLTEDIEDFLSWALDVSKEWGHKKGV